MTYNPQALRADFLNLRANEKGLHALEIAERLAASECQLLASTCGAPALVSAVRLRASWPAFIAELPKLGHVKTVTRNPHAVIEVEGTYEDVEFFGVMGQSVGSVNLRIFVSRWAHGFAVREETKRGLSRSLQFFDETGRAIHKSISARRATSPSSKRSCATTPRPIKAPCKRWSTRRLPPPRGATRRSISRASARRGWR